MSLLVPSAILLAQNNGDVFKRSGSPTPALTNADIFKPLHSPTPQPERTRPFQGVQIDTQTGGIKMETGDPDYDRGFELATSGHPAEALDYFERSLRTDPTNPQTHLNRAEAFYQLDDYQHEIEECNKAIELSKAGWVLRRGHSVKLENNSDPSINKDLADAYAKRGIAKWNLKHDLKDKQSAVADFDEAIRRGERNYSTVYCYRGQYYFDEGNLDNALRDFNAALTANPNSALAYGMRALAELKQGKDALAASDLYRAGQINPEIREQCAKVAEEIRAARGK